MTSEQINESIRTCCAALTPEAKDALIKEAPLWFKKSLQLMDAEMRYRDARRIARYLLEYLESMLDLLSETEEQMRTTGLVSLRPQARLCNKSVRRTRALLRVMFKVAELERLEREKAR